MPPGREHHRHPLALQGFFRVCRALSQGRFPAPLGPDVAGLMLTNPSTLGLFEANIEEVAKIVHQGFTDREAYEFYQELANA